MPGIFVKVFSISEIPATRLPSRRRRKSATRPVIFPIIGRPRPHEHGVVRPSVMSSMR